MAEASDSALCDADCQKNRTANKLRQTYNDAVQTADTAPHQVDIAFKKYITFSQGEHAYNETVAQQIRKTADENKKNTLESFQNSINAIKKLIKSYSIIYRNYNNVKNLHTRMVKKNYETELRLKNKTSDSLVNDRKSYYDDQQLNNLKWYATILQFLYGCISLGFILLFILSYVKNGVFRKDAIIWSAVLIIFPFISMYLYNFILKILKYINAVS